MTQSGSTLDLFRHLYERLLRVYDIIDSQQRDLSSNVLDMMQNQESRKLIEAVNRLTIFSMIFLPLTFLSGLFELNFATTSEPFILPVSGALLFVFCHRGHDTVGERNDIYVSTTRLAVGELSRRFQAATLFLLPSNNDL